MEDKHGISAGVTRVGWLFGCSDFMLIICIAEGRAAKELADAGLEFISNSRGDGGWHIRDKQGRARPRIGLAELVPPIIGTRRL